MQFHQVIIIGSGFGGQCAAINLIKNNIQDFIVLERRDFMGGTWCQNSYPGAAVDVPSPLYSISHEPYPWTQMYANQSELEKYSNFVIDKYQLREKTVLNANVTKVTWDDAAQHWVINTSQGDFQAQFVINASGPLSQPVIPNFEGRESFQGKSFHTNQWDHSYDYRHKRVAIIGSGASAAQIIPAIAPDCAHLYVFQRTPHWVLPRHDRHFSQFEQKLLEIKPLYQILRSLIYWGLETRIIGFKYSKKMLDALATQPALAFIKKQISDPVLQQKVTPDFTIGCKRIILSSTLYPALCRDNVTLFDKHQGIRKITENGIVTEDGQVVDVDLIIYSTGYDATDGVVSYPIVGQNGQTMADFWQQYPRAYLGTSVPKFPNLFLVTGPNTGIGHTSALFIIESQMNYILNSIQATLSRQAKSIAVKVGAEEKYTDHIHQEMKKTVWKWGGCRSWYQSKSGHVIAMFPGFSFTFWGLTRWFKPQDHDFKS